MGSTGVRRRTASADSLGASPGANSAEPQTFAKAKFDAIQNATCPQEVRQLKLGKFTRDHRRRLASRVWAESVSMHGGALTSWANRSWPTRAASRQHATSCAWRTARPCRALCPLAGPPTTASPPPGAIYLGVDASKTRVWATTDGRVICTAAKPVAANVAADALPPPPPPNSWFNRRTVCCATIALLTHFLVLGVAVGWAAGRPSTGMGFIVGLPTAAHEAGALARRAFDLFSPMSIAHTVIEALHRGNELLWLHRHLATPLLLPACDPTLQSGHLCASPAPGILPRVHANARRRHATIHHTHHLDFGVGPMLAALSYLVGGSLGAAACIMVPCVTTSRRSSLPRDAASSWQAEAGAG